MMIIYFL